MPPSSTETLTPKPIVLPNGMRMMQLQSATTLQMYGEIFVDRCYDVSGLDVRPGDVILDVGANVGVATLFLHDAFPDARIVSLEPSPPAFSALRQNLEEHGIDGIALNVAVGRERSTRSFPYYPQMTVMSGFDADPEGDARRVLDALEASGLSEEEAKAVLAGRFEPTSVDVEVVTISDVVRDHGVERVPLVKIDTEGFEVEILQGIDEHVWPRMGRFVGELHSDEDVEEVGELLRGHGYELAARELAGPGFEGFFVFVADRQRALDP